MAGCSVSDDADPTGERRPLGKADAIGSCADDDGDHCGGKSDGNCWCDDLCEQFDDCCADKGDVCDPPQLCLSDDACQDGEVCDHSECLSGCPDGGICPAVCYGQCVPGGGGDDGGEGCLASSQCGDDEYCHFESECGEGPVGDCETRPEFCIEIFAPVCGCDGVTYGNSCFAASAGVSVQSEGECDDGSDPNSCEGHCDGPAPGGCWCDDLCEAYGDCCDDKADACDAPTCSAQGDSCAGGETCCDGLQCCSGVPVPQGAEFCGQVCPISDKNKKENFLPIDSATILDEVSKLEITTWNYKAQDPSVRHLGPMAQDFKAAFELGSTDKAIFTIDADGVALASIQALDAELTAVKRENKALRRTLETMGARLQKLERRSKRAR